MLEVRRSAERGTFDHGWLKTSHTFSFADYYDPRWVEYGALRVINDDRVAPGRGFGKHGHRDMEIITYILEGELEHRDSLGNGSVIRVGDVQRLSAGSGVTHSEFNPSSTAEVHFLQIWILPARAGLQPGYEQKAFPLKERQGALRLVASTDGRDGSVTVHQDVNVYATLLDDHERVRYAIPRGRATWIHVAQGAAELNGSRLDAGDAAAFREDGIVEVVGREWADVLIFDLSQGGRS